MVIHLSISMSNIAPPVIKTRCRTLNESSGRDRCGNDRPHNCCSTGRIMMKPDMKRCPNVVSGSL